MTDTNNTPRRSDGAWTLMLRRESLAVLASEPAFHALLRLARHLNALRFAQAAIVSLQHDDGPVGLRARSSAFFYMGSVLVEALDLLPTLRAHYSATSYWDASFGTCGSDAQVRALIAKGTDLQRLRNHVGFHVLPMVPQQSLPSLDLPEYVFVRANGRQVGQMYFELADQVALHYLLDSPGSFSELIATFEQRGARLTALTEQFMSAADILIPRALDHYRDHFVSSAAAVSPPSV